MNATWFMRMFIALTGLFAVATFVLGILGIWVDGRYGLTAIITGFGAFLSFGAAAVLAD